MSLNQTKPVALVTGGNTGIGFETCRGLLKSGFHVVLCARSSEKGNRAIAELLEDAPEQSTGESLLLDLGSLKSVRTAAETFLSSERALSVCVLNAGIMALPWHRTEDGYEQQWQVNVLGHFLLCRLLLPAMGNAEGPTGRVLHLSSRAHLRHPQAIDYEDLKQEHLSDENFDRWIAYGRSKLANILFSNELARRLKESGSAVTSNALHPGLVATNLLTNAGGNLGRGVPVEDGAKTSLYLATSPDVEGQSGGYYSDSKLVMPGSARSEISSSDKAARALWTHVCQDLGLSEELEGQRSNHTN